MNTTTARRAWACALVATALHDVHPAPTWDEWCVALGRRIGQRQHYGDRPFSDRELAHLVFLRWLIQTGRVLP